MSERLNMNLPVPVKQAMGTIIDYSLCAGLEVDLGWQFNLNGMSKGDLPDVLPMGDWIITIKRTAKP